MDTDVCLVCSTIELPDDGLTQRPPLKDLLAKDMLEDESSTKSYKMTGIRIFPFSCRMEFLKVRDGCDRTGLILSQVAVLALVMSDQATFGTALVLKQNNLFVCSLKYILHFLELMVLSSKSDRPVYEV